MPAFRKADHTFAVSSALVSLYKSALLKNVIAIFLLFDTTVLMVERKGIEFASYR
jgi:hypothetical protein